MSHRYATFDDWLDEKDGYATRRERLGHDIGPANVRALMPWLQTAWELGAGSAGCQANTDTSLRSELHAVTRFEVIDEEGRVYVRASSLIGGPRVSVELHLQDEGRTLKAFVKKKEQATC